MVRESKHQEEQVMNHTNEMTLKGRINIELIPGSKWRELAVKGVRTMSYAISGKAVIDGLERSVNIKVPALDNGELVGLGSAAPWGTGEEVEIINGIFPKNPRPRGLDTAVMRTDNENKILVVDGTPVYEEPAIIVEEGDDIGQEFNLLYGTNFYCPNKSGLTLKFTDVGLHESERPDESGYPWVDCSFSSYSVVSAQSTRAKGAALAFTCKAARASTKAVVEPVTDQVTQPTEA